MLSSQNFVDAGALHSGNTVFTGVPVGAANYLPGAVFTPQVAVANFGAQPVNATVLFARTGDSGPEASNVATVSVPAMSARTVPLPPSLTGDPELRNSFIVQSSAAPGTLLASVTSVGSSGYGLVEQIGKDQQMPENGGGHPWDLSGGRDAVLLLFNHSTVAKYFNVKIGNGRVLWQQAWQLAPMETRSVSIRDLIAGQVKDRNGAVLPPAVEQGEIGWFNPNPGEGKGRLMQIDPSSQSVAGIIRLARNFSCSYPYVICGAYLYVNSIDFAEGTDSAPQTLGEVIPEICTNNGNGGCSGQSSSESALGYTYSWVSNSPAIATVYGSSTSPTAAFWGAGRGTGSAVGYVASASCSAGGYGTPNVFKPDHLQVVGDITGTIQSCPTTVYRSVHYQVVDSSNTAAAVAVSISEAYLNSPVNNTCNTGQPSPSSCQPTDGSGRFYDTLQVGCNKVGASCGFTLKHEWNWCKGGTKVLSTLTDGVHNNQVTVNGYTGPIPNGTQFH